MLNVDMGYASFKLAFGDYYLWERKYIDEIAIAAWDNTPFRNEVQLEYKAGRSKGKEDIIEMVHTLRDEILNTSPLPIVNIEGAEADDIVACWNIFNPEDKIVGIDKDFLQLPEVFTLYSHDMKPYHYADVIDKTPKYLQELADKNFALYQILVGDATDNVPRILSKGREGKEQVQDCLKALDRGDIADTLYNMFEDKIIENAKMILFPFYQFSDFLAYSWWEAWSNGHYYDKKYWKHFYGEIKSKIPKQKPVKQNSYFDALFDL